MFAYDREEPQSTPTRRESAASAMSELSISQSIRSMDHNGNNDYNGANERPEESRRDPKPASGHLSTSGAPPMDQRSSQHLEEEEPKPKKSFCATILNELQCVLDSDEKELDPFAKRRNCLFFVVAVVAIVLNLVVIPLVLTNMEHNKNSNNPNTNNATRAPSHIPSFQPSSWPTELGQTREPTTDKPTTLATTTPTPAPTTLASTTPTPAPATVAIALPPYTLAELNNPDSPQTKAFQWLTADPNLSTYTSYRTLQRMALATFFYATNDQDIFYQQQQQSTGEDPEVFANLFRSNQNQKEPLVWTNASNWLSYDIHECFWYSQAPFVCDVQQNYRFLILNDNALMGTLPPQLGLLTKLEQLHLNDNMQIYANIPTHIAYLTNLQSLQLSNLPLLSGTIPNTIANLHASMQQIHLRETPFFPKILSTTIGRLTRLNELLLDTRINTGSGVTTKQGTLPTQLGNLRALHTLTITGEEIVGTLPQQLANLSSLQSILIANTQVTGSIPPQYGGWQSIAKIELSNNRLSSGLPKQLGKLRKTLTSLALNDNQFIGTIPFQYSNLTKCATMSFQHNILWGTVPLGLCYLRTEGFIQTLRVDCNDQDTVSASSSTIQCTCDCECY